MIQFVGPTRRPQTCAGMDDVGLWRRTLQLCSYLMLLASCDGSSEHPPREQVPRQSVVPPVPSVPGLTGVTGSQLLAEVRKSKQGALVNMWASWCGNCKKELPILIDLQAAYRDQGLDLLLVSADSPDALPAARALLDELGIERPAYHIAGSVPAFKSAVDARWKGAIPATFLIDPQGRVRFFWNGPVVAEEIVPVVQRYLSGEEVDGQIDVAARPLDG